VAVTRFDSPPASNRYEKRSCLNQVFEVIQRRHKQLRELSTISGNINQTNVVVLVLFLKHATLELA
jgi:hypothetical protein